MQTCQRRSYRFFPHRTGVAWKQQNPGILTITTINTTNNTATKTTIAATAAATAAAATAANTTNSTSVAVWNETVEITLTTGEVDAEGKWRNHPGN